MGELFAACISDNNNNIITILVMISVMQIHAGMYANVHAHIVRMAVHIANQYYYYNRTYRNSRKFRC